MKADTMQLTVNLHDNEVYSQFDVNDTPVLCEELTSTIQQKASTKKINSSLNITFATSKNSLDEEKFKKAYNDTFRDKVKTQQNELKRCILTGVILLLVGMTILVFDVLFNQTTQVYFFQLFNVFSWVFCWGGMEVLTIELIQIVIEIKKLNKLLSAKLYFKSIKI